MPITLVTLWISRMRGLFTSFPLADRPAHLRAQSSVHVWSHETEWDKLRLHQGSFSDDVVVFRKIVSNLFHNQGVPWESFQGRSLRFLASTLKFASLPWRPTETCDGRVLSRVSALQCGSSLRAFLKAPCGQINPQSLWRLSFMDPVMSPKSGASTGRFTESAAFNSGST